MAIALVELFEAEGRLLRRATLNTWLWLLCLLVAAVLVLVGAILFLWACYQWLSLMVGPIMAKALVGLIAIGVAGGFAWVALRKNR